MESKDTKLAKARELFLNNRNCAQSTAAPFAEECGISEEQILKALSAFGGGVAGTKGTCGVVTGMAMVIGMTEEKALSTLGEDKAEIKATGQRLILQFTNQFDTSNCGKLLEAFEKNPIESEDPVYKDSPCTKLVEAGVEILYDYLSSK